MGIATSNLVNVRRVKFDEIENDGENRIERTEGDSLIVDPCARCAALTNDWHVEWVIEQNGSAKPLNDSRISVNAEGSLIIWHVDPADGSDHLRFVNVLRHKRLTEIPTREVEVKSLKLQVIKRDAAGSFPSSEPVFLTPSNVLGKRGESLKLSCIYSGMPVPQVTWYRNGSIIQASDHDGLTGPQLVIRNVTLDDQGLYACVVEHHNHNNMTGRNVTRYGIFVTVVSAPYFQSRPEDIVATPGSSFAQRYNVLGIPRPDIRWFYNGVPYLENEKARKLISDEVLLIYSAERKDTGNYGCSATNEFGSVWMDFNVRVDTIAPHLLRKSPHLKVFEGSDVKLYCEFYGIPRPMISWDIEYQMWGTNGDRYHDDMTGRLTIQNVTLDDARRFKCRANNEHGAASSTVELTIWRHTEILGEMMNYEIPLGDTVTIGCEVTSDPRLNVTVTWHKNNDTLSVSGPRFIHNPFDNSLAIRDLTDGDAGVYQCSASTDHDEVLSDRGVVKRMIVPQLPQLTLESCNLTHAVLLVENQGDNGTPIEYYRIEYNTSVEPEHWRIAVAQLKPTAVRFELELAARTKCSWRAVAVNQWGASRPSLVTSHCSTSTGVPSRNPTNLRAEGTTPGALTITWDPVNETEQNGAEFRYVLYWKNYETGGDWHIEFINDWRNTSVTLRNLGIYQKHWIEVGAVNELGAARDTANVIGVYSGESNVIEPPYALEVVEKINEHSILIRWLPDNTYRGRITKYSIDLWNDASTGPGHVVTETPPFVTSTIVAGVKPNVINYVTVRAHSRYYQSPPSQPNFVL